MESPQQYNLVTAIVAVGLNKEPQIERVRSLERKPILNVPSKSVASIPLVSEVPPAKVSIAGDISTGCSIASDNNEYASSKTKEQDSSFNHFVSQNSDTDESNRGERILKRTICNCGYRTKEKDRCVLHGSSVQHDGICANNVRLSRESKKPRIEYNLKPIAPNPTKVVLLAMPKDSAVLSPLHVFVRQQIEVFSASEVDMAQPAPGRKHRIQLNQVGLRCIHCRDLPLKDRVKRAACYPSSLGRIYHSVSDMKFDHFPNCKGLPCGVREKFKHLKEENKKKQPKKRGSKSSDFSSSTAQYYHDSAFELGMVDSPSGIFMSKGFSVPSTNKESKNSHIFATETAKPVSVPCKPTIQPEKLSNDTTTKRIPPCKLPMQPLICNVKNPFDTKTLAADYASMVIPMGTRLSHETVPLGSVVEERSTSAPSLKLNGKCSLSSPTDKQHLNPLHCFVRRHIEVFVANESDIKAPSPGRKTRVVLGQVGLRCIHCAKLPPKERVKRAVCYPASVGGIYHSVSNMKFDHFGKCRGLPEDQRSKFTLFRSSCGRYGSRGSKESTLGSNSTAQYYHDSALRLGLVDSKNGICLDKSDVPPQLDHIPDGIAALMIAASVRAADSTIY